MPAFQPIENHAVIGDLHTVGLVALDGTLDFLSFPSFDSPTIFAALLDPERGGFFSISPELDGAKCKQLYLPDSNVLLTRFLSADGVAEISDFMPVEEAGKAHSVVRRVKTVRGKIRFVVRCAPRLDYARAPHRCEANDGGCLFTSDDMAIRLRSSVAMEVDGGDAVASFTLRANESAAFVLEAAREELGRNIDDYVSHSFKSTLNYWRDWIGHCRYQGRWREQVNRSALTLKLLVSQPHGSLVAAPTFGLPEVIGGPRNWDYRYTWIRDASFTVYALMRLGCTGEAGAFIHWIEARCRELKPDGSLQIMYRLDGGHDLREETLEHLRGYRGSHPVRIGNGAAQQCQLDIHGELMDSVYLYDKWGLPISHDFWQNLVRLVDWVTAHWSEADTGIWETRKGPQEFLYSRLMCWVAVDRGIRLARKRSLPAPLARWEQVRDAIYEDIFANFWDARQRAFVQHRGSKTVDASCLLMPLVKFIAPRDPRWLSTLAAIDRTLVEDSLVYRYGHDDPSHEGTADGTFCMCTFWFAECLAKAGDVKRARFIFEKMLGYANHVGLYAEQLGPAGEHLGNFPQAFTHLGLISAAYAIDRELQQQHCNGALRGDSLENRSFLPQDQTSSTARNFMAMPPEKTTRRTRSSRKKGSTASSQAGEYVREEIETIRKGVHGARSAKQAIAIGLSKARRAGVKLPLPKKGNVPEKTRTKAKRDVAKAKKDGAAKPSRKRSQSTLKALRWEKGAAASKTALSRHARAAARKRSPAQRAASARKAARTRAAKKR